MSAGDRKVITLVGMTGAGKSTLGNKILEMLGNSTCPFAEGDSILAVTRQAKAVVQGDIIVVDNPGLMDSDGVAQDQNNISTIVKKARELGHLNMLVLVLNWENPRFDDSVQSAVKLISDSFGKDCLDQLFIVYTKCYRRTEEMKREVRTAQIRDVINRRCGVNRGHITYYAVENHPEEFVGDFTDKRIEDLEGECEFQIRSLLRVARGQADYKTSKSKAGEYEHVLQLKKEVAARKAAEAALAKKRAEEQEIEERNRKRAENVGIGLGTGATMALTTGAGAGIGTAVFPGVGTVIGAGIGAAYGAISSIVTGVMIKKKVLNV